jgi:hypothetical protein
VLLSSCAGLFVNEVDLDKIKDLEKKLVVKCNPAEGDYYMVAVQQTKVIFNSTDTTNKVDDAQVFVINGTDTALLKPISEEQILKFYRKYAIYFEANVELPSIFVDSTKRFVAGNFYKILVKYKNLESSADLVIDKSEPVFECELDTLSNINREYGLRTVFNLSINQVESEAYYIYRLFNYGTNYYPVSNTLDTFSIPFSYPIFTYRISDLNDEYPNTDQSNSIIALSSKDGVAKLSFFTEMASSFKFETTKDDTVELSIQKIDKSYYDYLIKTKMNSDNKGNPFSEPTFIPTNVINGLGNVSSVGRKSLYQFSYK